MSAQPKNRSVVDYVTEQELKDALETVTPQDFAKSDWMLPVEDPEAEPQTVQGELARLMTLKSFMMLDADQDPAFDALTQEACQIFGVPTSLISLIDLGRQFLFSNTGAGGVRETTRAVAFCSHTILNKKGIVNVGDTKEDERFKESPLVTQAPHLRFYAGAPLISPEGHKLGTFCVEGPTPRPGGLNEEEKLKLKEYAAKAMELMVERRKNLRDRLSGAASLSQELRLHAAVTTNLGDILYWRGDSVTAMRLFQESVQTIMYVEEENGHKPDKDRQTIMSQLLQLLSIKTLSETALEDLLARVKALYTDITDADKKPFHANEGIPGLFSSVHDSSNSKLKGLKTPLRPLPSLFFAETFQIDMDPDTVKKPGFPLDERPFTVSLGECSKATLFNMGLVHYHWGSPELALQFFHLAASVSHKLDGGLYFDPVDLASTNNMAQVHLQAKRIPEAVDLLQQALERGSKSLEELYAQTEPADGVYDDEEVEDDDLDVEKLNGDAGAGGTGVASPDDEKKEEESKRHTRRLRRKLARTILSMAHVHFIQANYDASMASCKQALPLLDSGMTGITRAAVWYNMSCILHHQGQLPAAVEHLEKFLVLARKLNGPDHLQNADALYYMGQIKYEMGLYKECMPVLTESLRIRKAQLGPQHGIVADSVGLMGKVHLALNEYDLAVQHLQECTDIQQFILQDNDLTFDAAQTLLDLGRAHQAKGDLEAALKTYLQVMEWTRKFFGPDHAFCARIATIVGNLYQEAGQAAEAKPFLDEAAQIHAKAAVAS